MKLQQTNRGPKRIGTRKTIVNEDRFTTGEGWSEDDGLHFTLHVDSAFAYYRLVMTLDEARALRSRLTASIEKMERFDNTGAW